MHPDLKGIVEVQQLDQQVAELTVQIDSLPKQIQTLQSQLDDFIHTHEERKKRLAANLKERKDLESEIKAIQEKITKHKDQLYQVKTNDQYRAMLKEIEGEEGEHPQDRGPDSGKNDRVGRDPEARSGGGGTAGGRKSTRGGRNQAPRGRTAEGHG